MSVKSTTRREKKRDIRVQKNIEGYPIIIIHHNIVSQLAAGQVTMANVPRNVIISIIMYVTCTPICTYYAQSYSK